MPAQRRTVGKRRVVADLAIVCNVHVGHDPVVVADAGDARVLNRSPIQGAKFADRVVVADRKECRFASVFLVLRGGTQRIELPDAVAAPDRGRPFDDAVRTDPRTGADAHPWADDAVRSYFDIGR